MNKVRIDASQLAFQSEFSLLSHRAPAFISGEKKVILAKLSMAMTSKPSQHLTKTRLKETMSRMIKNKTWT